jgi:hypothetical protein
MAEILLLLCGLGVTSSAVIGYQFGYAGDGLMAQITTTVENSNIPVPASVGGIITVVNLAYSHLHRQDVAVGHHQFIDLTKP